MYFYFFNYSLDSVHVELESRAKGEKSLDGVPPPLTPEYSNTKKYLEQFDHSKKTAYW